MTHLTTASTLDVVSDSSNDDGSPAGTGAQTILITGLDANRKTQTEILTMDGTTTVTTTKTYLGVNRIVVLSSGSTNSNVGNITVTATTGGSNPNVILSGVVRNMGVTDTFYEVFSKKLDVSLGNRIPIEFPVPLSLSATDVLELVLETDQNNVNISGTFGLIEYRDADA